MSFTMVRVTYLICLLAVLENIYVKGYGGETFKDLELERQLKILNKPYVKSFKIGDNDFDTFDCVDIYQQPALSHPLLKGHKIQMSPSDIPTIIDHVKSSNRGEDVGFWNLSETCPAGTVPIRRTRKQDLIMSQTLMEKPNCKKNFKNYQAAVMTWTNVGPCYGGIALINIQSPKVTEKTQLTEAYMQVQAIKGGEANLVQAGWKVYNDTQPRLTASWALFRGRKETGGCTNIECPGFVQVHSKVALGMPLPSSTYGGDQQEAAFLIYKSHADGNWWFTLENEAIGYWPDALFTTMQKNGDVVLWGGRVFAFNDAPSGGMGSGHFAEEGYQKAAYFNKLMYLDFDFNRHHIVGWDQLNHIVSDPKCYTLAPYGSNGIFYGGPGGNCSA